MNEIEEKTEDLPQVTEKAVDGNAEDSSKGLALFEKSFDLALKIPGVKVDRCVFLKHELKPYVSSEKLNSIAKLKTFDLVDEKILDVIADAIIKNHIRAATLLSACSGAPANPLASVGLAAADITQYFAQVLMLAQKTAYIYGFPDLMDENKNFTEIGKEMLFILLAVSFGCKFGDQKIRLALAALAKGVEKKLPQQALTKTWWYPIIKKIAPWFGEKMTKQKMGALAGKVIPLVGIPLSGTITYFSFRSAAKNLKEKCKEQMALFKNPSSLEKQIEEIAGQV